MNRYDLSTNYFTSIYITLKIPNNGFDNFLRVLNFDDETLLKKGIKCA